jgi:hypothetical protein
MRRISSLPTAEFCPKVDKIGQDIETTQSLRSTVFHEYCDTGKWPDALRTLPEADREEIGKWVVPSPFVLKAGNVTHALPYKESMREMRVALDKDFNYVEIPTDVPQEEIEARHPEAAICGHLDMAWHIAALGLVVVCDIKSSIFAVADRTDTLQLHGYGIALAKKLGCSRYLTAIWDASDGRYYVAKESVEMDSFEMEALKARISMASVDRDGNFVTGTHCAGCWKRKGCPAHLVDVPEETFRVVLSGEATESDVREALVRLKQIGDLSNRVGQSIKDWVAAHGYVRSEDGKKVYRAQMRDGKEALDKEAIQAALGVQDLKQYMKKGGEFPVFDWRKA